MNTPYSGMPIDYYGLEDAKKSKGSLKPLLDILRRKSEAVGRYVRELKRKLDLRLVILFGSLAKGSWTESSDIDLLIVSDDLFNNPAENFIKLKRGCVEPHGFSTKRFMAELEKPNLLIMDALEYGQKARSGQEIHETR